jgi:hypothetical protein
MITITTANNLPMFLCLDELSRPGTPIHRGRLA